TSWMVPITVVMALSPAPQSAPRNSTEVVKPRPRPIRWVTARTWKNPFWSSRGTPLSRTASPRWTSGRPSPSTRPRTARRRHAVLGVLEDVDRLAARELLEHQLAGGVEVQVEATQLGEVLHVQVETPPPVDHIRRERDPVVGGGHVHRGLPCQVPHDHPGRFG